MVCSDYFVVDNMVYMATINKKQYIACVDMCSVHNNKYVFKSLGDLYTTQLTLGIVFYCSPILYRSNQQINDKYILK